MNKLNDHFFRGFLSDIRIAKEFCTQFLPDTVQKLFDVETISIAKTTFIEPNLREIISDVVFSFKNNEQTSYVYVMVEHQSYPDRFLPIRMSRYIFSLMQEHVKNNKDNTIPLVYPMVFYNGTPSPYPAPRRINELFSDSDRAQGVEWLLEPFHIVDLQQISDEKLREFTWSGVMAFVMKHREKQNFFQYLQNILPDLKKMVCEEVDGVLQHFVHYTILSLSKTATTSREQVVAFFYQISENIGGEAMILAEELQGWGVQEGMQQGMQQGRQLGIQEGIGLGEERLRKEIIKNLVEQQYDLSKISAIVQLSESEIKQMLG